MPTSYARSLGIMAFWSSGSNMLLWEFADCHTLSLCFLSIIASFSHCIVSSVVWRSIYNDSVHPFVKQPDIEPRLADREKRDFSLLFLINIPSSSVLSSTGTTHNYPLSIPNLYPSILSADALQHKTEQVLSVGIQTQWGQRGLLRKDWS